MSAVASRDGRLVFEDPRYPGAADIGSTRSIGLSPLLIGFALPFLVIGYFHPTALQHVRFVFPLVLGLVFVAALLLFILSVFSPRMLVAALVDPGRKQLVLVENSLFARAEVVFALDQIGNIAMNRYYDEDGYPTMVAELTLRSGDKIALPAGVDAEAVRTMRAALGLR